MGCTQSKIENEEAVSRCKDRKLFMKEAVTARNQFAAGHSSYTMYLKHTGAALSDYAHAEVQNHPQFSSSSAAANSAGAAAPGVTTQPPFESIRPPPPPLLPPLPIYPINTLQRAATMPEFKILNSEKTRTDTIIEEEIEDDEEEDYEESEASSGLKHRSRSSRTSNVNMGVDVEQVNVSLPPPPSPPPPPVVVNERVAPPPPMPENKDSTWDYFFPPPENMSGPSLSEVEEIGVDKVERERKVFEERSKRSGGDADVDKVSEVMEKPPPPPSTVVAKNMKKVKQGASSGLGSGSASGSGSSLGSGSGSGSGSGPGEGRRVGGKSVAYVNLLQIFVDLDDHFLKASESAHDVSKMLEATRLHYHSNFADNRGHIDHSARVMRVITWNRSFKGLPNADDGKDDFDSEEHETHATVLDKLLAWEKKLYDEVKAGELMKFEYQKKVAMLNKQKKRGTNSEAMEKMKAAVSHLHTRYIVDMQSMDSTVLEINRLRDEQLYPKLVALVEGMAIMWETMKVHHESQSKIVMLLRSVDISHTPKETSEQHYGRTEQLGKVVQEWHTQFGNLVIYQKEYIKTLNNWLKLNLIPIESSLKEKISSPLRVPNPAIKTLLSSWQDYLEKLPDEPARSAIFNFAAIVNSILTQQEEELKLKEKCEETRKELNRKTRQFEDWYNKYMQRRPDEMDPERTEDGTHKDVLAEKKFVVDSLKKRLEDEDESYRKQCLHVREKSWASLKSSLPELFRALSEFSHSCSEMYKNLRYISQSKHNPGESAS